MMPQTQASTTDPLVLREMHGAVCVLTLNRPQTRNSLSEAMITALHSALSKASVDNRIHAVVLAASGPAFCAGHDLKELTAHRTDADRGQAFFHRTMAACSAAMQAIVALPKPVIAAVHGMATAAGCQLVATCDLAVAAADARFATPGVDIGLFCTTPAVALARAVPRKQALEMLYTGAAISAERAHAIGLVNRVVAEGRARDEAIALAQLIAGKSTTAIKTGKAAFYRQVEMPLADAYHLAARTMTENLLTHDAEEGIGAFLEKRPPRWPDH